MSHLLDDGQHLLSLFVRVQFEVVDGYGIVLQKGLCVHADAAIGSTVQDHFEFLDLKKCIFDQEVDFEIWSAFYGFMISRVQVV